MTPSLPKLGYFLRPISTSSTIKNTVSMEPLDGLYPAFSASGQDVWTPYFDFEGDALILSAVGAQSGKTFEATGRWGCVANTTGFALCRDANRRFFWYLTNLPNFWERGGAAQPYVKVSESLRLRIDLPSPEKQRAIAAFLDGKCAKVDEAVRIKEEQITLLRERRQILIQQAVTRGLNRAASMKDSGIDWIGQIPAHWEVVPLKRLFRERNDRSTTGAETLLSLRMNEGLVPHDDVSDKAIGADALKDYKQVFPGQMVMNRMRASIGIFGMVTSCGIVSPDYAIFDIAARANGDFFLQLFKTGVIGQQFRNASRGLGTGSSGFMRLYTDDFGAISVALPPPAEQTDIVSHIDSLSQKIEDAVRLKEEQIASLKEYKTSLINAAVTGKIKVA